MNIVLIRERYKSQNRGNRKRTASDHDFVNLYFDSLDLLFKAFEKKNKNDQKYPLENRHKSIAIGNFLSNMVTALEVYFKKVIVNGNNWNELAFDDLLREKISLSEAYKLFNKEKISREFLISHTYSFQNLDTINKTFSALCGEDFIRKVETTETKFFDLNGEGGFSQLILVHPDWWKSVSEIINLRNMFVHEGYTKVKLEQVLDYWHILGDFQEAMEQYFHKRVMDALKLDIAKLKKSSKLKK